MAYSIAYKKSVGRDLKKLGKAKAKKIIGHLEKVLTKKADTFPVLKGRFAGLRKYRFGNYRVIYAILDDNVLVLRIRHRKDVYKTSI